MKKTAIPQDILSILSASAFEGNEMRLPSSLDRAVYQKVAKVVDSAGGKWNRKAAAHVFPGDAQEAIEPLLMTGEFMRPQDMGQFDSPPEVVARLIELAEIETRMDVLEPSAGVGNIAEAILKLSPHSLRLVEIDPKRVDLLRMRFGGDTRVRFAGHDFLTRDPNKIRDRFDRIVMNPPFAPRQADIDHVLHAAKFLKPGGRLVSVMAAGIKFRQNRKTTEFVKFLQYHGYYGENLPDKSFKMSGTTVNTCIVAFNVGR